jgi:hypothetical protein
VPPYTRDPSRDPVGAAVFFALSSYFLSRGLSKDLAGVAPA